MKIYTKTGDQGETSMGSGKRLSKDSHQATAYGEVDECNAVLGICRSLNRKSIDEIDNVSGDKFREGALFLEEIFAQLQKDLWMVGADLASPQNKKVGGKIVPRVSENDVKKLEEWIDRIDSTVQPLKSFIVPGGTLLSSHLHLARTVCRRAERAVVALAHAQKIAHEDEIAAEILIYLNRLSDLLFMMARYANTIEGLDDELLV